MLSDNRARQLWQARSGYAQLLQPRASITNTVAVDKATVHAARAGFVFATSSSKGRVVRPCCCRRMQCQPAAAGPTPAAARATPSAIAAMVSDAGDIIIAATSEGGMLGATFGGKCLVGVATTPDFTAVSGSPCCACPGHESHRQPYRDSLSKAASDPPSAANRSGCGSIKLCKICRWPSAGSIEASLRHNATGAILRVRCRICTFSVCRAQGSGRRVADHTEPCVRAPSRFYRPVGQDARICFRVFAWPLWLVRLWIVLAVAS